MPLMKALPEGTKMIATGVVTPFLIPVKVTMMVAFMVALPFVLYQAWAFVAPGLYQHEKRFAMPVIVASTVLFLAGVGFCYFFVFGKIFSFINEFAPKSITPAPDIEQYLNFVITMFIAFGVTFEMPVLAFFLARTGAIDHNSLIRPWRYALIVIAIVAAVLTPGPDVASQMLLAAPLTLLYIVSIGVAWAFGRGKRPIEAE